MTALHRLVLLSLALVFVCACSGPAEQATVVIHRCGNLNMDTLAGTFGRLDGEQSINSKFRIRFDRDGEKVTARFVAGGHERFALTGRRSGNETMDFTEDDSGTSRRRRLKASLNSQCRLQVADGWVSGAGESEKEHDHPSQPYTFVPFDLSRLDFEPCTERLALGKAAKSSTPGTVPPAGEVPVITSDHLWVAQWSARSALPDGCTAQLDLWVNGEAEALEFPVQVGGPQIHWSFEYDTHFLGKKGLALHRVAKCGTETRILGVACAEIEVR